ncbi:hypothetical protein ABZ760_17985 [Streptomyces sp. NPDC006658]|uniref:hypothetical protein n=1 Tax=Streptomyces sp. NPDC006658 TaxID=3156900 RepID=UPI0033E56197
MAVPDDATSRSLSGAPQPFDPLPEGSDKEKPLRQRIADRWNRLGPAGKAGVIAIGGVAVAVVAGVLASSNPRAVADGAVEEEDDDPPARWWTNRAGGYYVCGHQGCGKKVNPTVFGHDCCGRCRTGRDCLSAAQRDYDGPGGFAHNYFEVLLRPGVCEVCGEPPTAHPWEYDSRTGQRHAAG